MLEIIKNTFLCFNGLPIVLIAIILYFNLDSEEKESKYRKMVTKLCLVLVVVCLAISVFKYVTKEYDDSDTKLIYNLNSSTFYAIGYDERFEKAKLIFNKDKDENGVWRVYIYDLPFNVWDEFKCSSSLGEYYNKNIKGIYKCEIIENDWYNPNDMYE